MIRLINLRDFMLGLLRHGLANRRTFASASLAAHSGACEPATQTKPRCVRYALVNSRQHHDLRFARLNSCFRGRSRRQIPLKLLLTLSRKEPGTAIELI